MLADLTIVGLGGGTLPVSFFGIPYEVSVQSTYCGNRAELVEVLTFDPVRSTDASSSSPNGS